MTGINDLPVETIGSLPETVDAALIDGVDLLSLDAGNTLIFFDHERFARASARIGFSRPPPVYVHAEGVMKVALESGEAIDTTWSSAGHAGSHAWGIAVGTLLHAAGLPVGEIPGFLEALWDEHRTLNFWSKVPDGLVASLSAVRALGVHVVVVSNSEGELEPFLARLGLLEGIDVTIDSGRLGIEKPDPRIFQAALAHFGVPATRALHLGDTYATDIVGARAAGIRSALIDPFGHYDGRHADVARVPSTRAVALAIVKLRAFTATSSPGAA